MLVKEITYFDLYGEELTEKFYFNLRQDEAVDVHLSEDGGLDAFIERIMTERNGKELVRLFKDFILKLGPTLDANEFDNPSEGVWVAKDAKVFP